MNYQKLLVLTDIHLVEEGSEIIGLDPFVRFNEVLDHAVAHHGDAERLIITGDLAHHGRVAQYERLKASLEQVEIPVTLLLGNHDRRDAFRDVFGVSGFVQARHEIGDVTCLCLDTLAGPPYVDGHHAGELCSDRMEWLKEQLETARDRVLLFMHHPPFDSGFDGMDVIKLADPDAFYELIHQFPKVEHLICGHVHRTMSGHARGMPFTILKSPCHQMPMLLGATGSAHSVDEPGAYGIVLLGPDSIVVHTQDVGLPGEPVLEPFSH